MTAAARPVHPSPRDRSRVAPGSLVQAQADDPQAPYVTVVLPCYNEVGHVLDELDRITAAMDASGYSYDLTSTTTAPPTAPALLELAASGGTRGCASCPSSATAARARSAGSAARTPVARSWCGPTPT